jgi:3-methyladenine DNA glycosylase AlkD
VRVVDKSDLEHLGRAEDKTAQERGLSWFKFDQDEDMLAAIDACKAKTVSV